MSLPELVERFDIERLARGEVVLESSRLRSLSTAHLIAAGGGRAGRRACCRLRRPAPTAEQVAALAPALRGAHTLAEAGDLVACVTEAPLRNRCLSWRRSASATPIGSPSRRRAALVDELRSAGVPLREARIALTGRERGPELWAVLAALPRDEAIRRAA